MNSFIALMRQDIALAWRQNSAGLSISFFMIAVALIPFGLGPDLKLLRDIAPGLVWVALLLAVLLSLESIFQADLEDGSFDQYLLSDTPLEILMLAKGLAHWLGVVLPLVLAAPLAGLLLNIDTPSLLPVCLILLAGSPAMSFLGMMGSALAAGVSRSGLLAALMVMPLYVPVLIFGSSALSQILTGAATDEWISAVFLLLSIGGAALFFGPLVAAAGLRAFLK
ncbi:MAG: heme exporter protein CcmB [PS1 clade bacterium]|uniref:Heme exporter protein B n=1 Tax=PS1 clade bacterium TaxID=2175152 RepID=A0A368E0Y5_9PROT|nr:MAG: heme exporter protein CcmB [PS1 clade bacterium]HCV48251.1 heme exporter protein CcmB [Rhodobiaceae bacterium]|tara:strand:- start:5486 stop:6157 length:672 start_codon:yes stop_codon:yes gene_type:complete